MDALVTKNNIECEPWRGCDLGEPPDAPRFGEKAEAYWRTARIQREVAVWLSKWLERDVRGLICMELGAGPGVFTPYLVDAGFGTVIATDLSAEMVALGRRTVPDAQWKVVDAWTADAPRVDRLYSSSLLQWAGNPAEILRQWRLLLPEGGRLLCSLFVEGSMREFVLVCPELCAFPWMSTGKVVEDMERAGFRVERSDEMERVESFERSVDALRSLHAIGAVRPRRFSAATLRTMLKRIDAAHAPLGHVPLTWRSLRVEAVAC
jgi:malonyl-CoA O-methyltransferase